MNAEKTESDKKQKSIISMKIQFATMMVFVAVAGCAMAVISCAMEHIVKKSVRDELESVGVLAVEAVKDDSRNDFSYNFLIGAFKSGDKVINNDFTLIRNLKESTDCALEFFWGDVCVYTTGTASDGKSAMFTRLDNDSVYNSIMSGNKVFLSDHLIDSKPFFVLYMPLCQPSSNSVVGVVSVTKPMKHYTGLMTRIKVASAFGLILFMLACSAVIYMVQSKTTKAITDLSRQLGAFIKNFESDAIDMNMRMTSFQMDEVGILAHDFNVFIMQIQTMVRKWKVKTIELSSYVAGTRLSMDDVMNDYKPVDDIPVIPSMYDDSLRIQKDLQFVDTMIGSLAKEFDKFERV